MIGWIDNIRTISLALAFAGLGAGGTVPFLNASRFPVQTPLERRVSESEDRKARIVMGFDEIRLEGLADRLAGRGVTKERAERMSESWRSRLHADLFGISASAETAAAARMIEAESSARSGTPAPLPFPEIAVAGTAVASDKAMMTVRVDGAAPSIWIWARRGERWVLRNPPPALTEAGFTASGKLASLNVIEFVLFSSDERVSEPYGRRVTKVSRKEGEREAHSAFGGY